MLKLMKHEFRATSRVMLPLYLLTILAALGGNVATRQLLETDHGLLNALGVLLMLAFVVALAAVCIMGKLPKMLCAGRCLKKPACIMKLIDWRSFTKISSMKSEAR